jgi:acyl-CoA synthetase (AMP-forming)/AMP-acid ligase II
MNIVDYFFEKPRNQQKPAIFMEKLTVNYAELYDRVKAVSGCLKNSAKNVLIVGDNSPFTIEAYLGIMGAGCVAVPLHPRTSEADFKYVIKTANIQTAFIQKKYLKKFPTDQYPSLKNIILDEAEESYDSIGSLPSDSSPFAEVDEKSDLAVIVYTSGSTGIPKGVMITHHNVQANSDSIIEYFKLKPDDRIMTVLPFSYCFGASLLHTHLRVGGEIVINNAFLFAGKVLEEINEKQCTGFAGVPSHFQILLRRTKMKSMNFPSLRYVAQAGGKLPNPFIKELMEALPNTKVYIMYGQTEATARLSYLEPDLLKTKLGSIGKGIPGVVLEVLNKQDKPVKPGEVGEIVATGENIMKGYWEDPKETAKVLRNGKLYTGDLATVDEDGFIYVVEREKQIIKSGGYRVSPKEVEDFIVAIPEVVEVAVIGVPDDILGEAIKAYITLKDPRHATLSADDVISTCRKSLPSYKVPKFVEFIRAIPKNTSGKVLKEELLKLEAKNQ